MTKEIENIILTKRFFELNDYEKKIVSEFAESEMDFEQLKLVLTELSALKNAERPTVNKEVKSNLNVLFEKTYNQKRLVWYNKLWSLLWPEEVRFYVRPLVQFATMIVLILCVVTFVPFNQKPELAMNETPEKPIKNQLESVANEKEEKAESPIEKLDSPAEKLEEMPVEEQLENNGWKLSDEPTVGTTDVLASQLTNQPTSVSSLDNSASGAAAEIAFDVEDSFRVDEVAFSRSVTTSQPNVFSPRQYPEVFDVLTALY